MKYTISCLSIYQLVDIWIFSTLDYYEYAAMNTHVHVFVWIYGLNSLGKCGRVNNNSPQMHTSYSQGPLNILPYMEKETLQIQLM